MIEVAPNSVHEMTYEQAIMYCQFCNHNGYVDWRLPTRQEYTNVRSICGWYVDSTYQNYVDALTVTPVRDIC